MRDAVRIDDRFSVARFAPDAEALLQAAEEGFRSVVNMQARGEDTGLGPEREADAAQEAGLAYLHHPVDGGSLSDATVDGFRRRAAELPTPVLVHCATGKRSGAMVMMTLAAEQGMSGDDVIRRAGEMGFECDTPALEDFVRSYVDRHRGDGA